MPTVLLQQGYRFFFWSNEGNELMHVHVEKGNGFGKIWLKPKIRIAYMHRFNPNEVITIMKIVKTNILILQEFWYEYFRK